MAQAAMIFFTVLLCCPLSADDQRSVFALAFGEPSRLHPVVSTVEQRRVVIVDVLVADEGAQQFARLQRSLRMRRDVMGIFVEVGIDAIDRLVSRVVISLPLLGA